MSSEYNKTVQGSMHITQKGQRPPSIEQLQRDSHRFGRIATEFVCRYDNDLGAAVVVGHYQTRRESCLLNADLLFDQFDDKALGRLIIEILKPAFAKEMPYVELGGALRKAMNDARTCRTGTVIVWVDERLNDDQSACVIHFHSTEVK